MSEYPERWHEASAMVMSCVVQDSELAAGIDQRDISGGAMRGLLSLINGRRKEGRPTDHRALIATSNGDLSTLGGENLIHDLLDRAANPATLGRYLAEARRFAVLRAVELAVGKEDVEAMRRAISHLDEEIAGEEAFVSAADVVETRIEWIWQLRIPRGGVTFLTGPRGKGKSIAAASIAAKISTGRGFLPGDSPREPGRVVMINVEDPADSVTTPRLRAQGAKLDNIDVWRWGSDGLVLPNNIAPLVRHVEKVRPAMVILDPVTAMVRPGLDPYKPTDVFQILRPLQAMAEEYDLSVVCVAHPARRKGGGDSGTDTSYVAGSYAWEAAARSILLFAPPPDAPPKTRDRLIAQGKSSWAEEVPPVLVRIGPLPSDSSLPVLSWVKEADVDEFDAEEVANGQPSTSRDRTKFDEAVAFLTQELENGEVPVAEVNRAATAFDISAKTLERARKHLGVTASKTYTGGRGKGSWVLRLPSSGGADGDVNGETHENPHGERESIDRHIPRQSTAPSGDVNEDSPLVDKDQKIVEGEREGLPREVSPSGLQDSVVTRIHKAYVASRIIDGGTGRYDLDRQGRSAIIQAVEAVGAGAVEYAVQGWRWDDWPDRRKYLALEQLLGGPKTGVKTTQIERFATLEKASLTTSPGQAWSIVESMQTMWPTADWTPKVLRAYLEAIARLPMAQVAEAIGQAEKRGDEEPPSLADVDEGRLL